MRCPWIIWCVPIDVSASSQFYNWCFTSHLVFPNNIILFHSNWFKVGSCRGNMLWGCYKLCLGAASKQRCRLTICVNPIMKIRLSHDYLIFVMKIIYPKRWTLHWNGPPFLLTAIIGCKSHYWLNEAQCIEFVKHMVPYRMYCEWYQVVCWFVNPVCGSNLGH